MKECLLRRQGTVSGRTLAAVEGRLAILLGLWSVSPSQTGIYVRSCEFGSSGRETAPSSTRAAHSTRDEMSRSQVAVNSRRGYRLIDTKRIPVLVFIVATLRPTSAGYVHPVAIIKAPRYWPYAAVTRIAARSAQTIATPKLIIVACAWGAGWKRKKGSGQDD